MVRKGTEPSECGRLRCWGWRWRRDGRSRRVWWMLNMATLWQLLILLCFGATVGGALASAKLAKVGFGGYALAVTIGLPLGVCCAWAMWIMHKIFVTSLRRRPDWEHWASQHEWFSATFYFTKILWIVFALFLGGWVSSAILRLVF